VSRGWPSTPSPRTLTAVASLLLVSAAIASCGDTEDAASTSLTADPSSDPNFSACDILPMDALEQSGLDVSPAKETFQDAQRSESERAALAMGGVSISLNAYRHTRAGRADADPIGDDPTGTEQLLHGAAWGRKVNVVPRMC
jgi:hypothetical protein